MLNDHIALQRNRVFADGTTFDLKAVLFVSERVQECFWKINIIFCVDHYAVKYVPHKINQRDGF